MEKKIFKDAAGNEFVLKEGFINDEHNQPRKVFIGKEPVLNPEGKQVVDPIIHYDHLINDDITVNNLSESKFPYYVFGSEFTGAEVQALPSPYSETLNTVYGNSMSMNIIADKIFDIDPDKANAYNIQNLELVTKTLVAQCYSAIMQSVLSLYNNNLRIILYQYLFDKSDDQCLNMVPLASHDLHINLYKFLENKMINGDFGPNIFMTFDYEDYSSKINSGSDTMYLSTYLMSNIARNISTMYADLILKLSNSNKINFMKLATDKLGDRIPMSYEYSAGVDFINEIANMECGILSDVVEINVMNMVYRFKDMASSLGFTISDK